MNTQITSADVKSKLEELIAVAGMIDPRVQLVEQGVEVLKNLFGKSGELNTMLAQVYAETKETAPDVAQAVSAYVTGQGDAMIESFRKHPGT